MINEESIMYETELITNFNKLTLSRQDCIQKEIIDFCNLNNRLGDNRPSRWSLLSQEDKYD